MYLSNLRAFVTLSNAVSVRKCVLLCSNDVILLLQNAHCVNAQTHRADKLLNICYSILKYLKDSLRVENDKFTLHARTVE